MSTEPSDPSVDIADVPVAPEPSNEASHVSEHPITANGNTLEPLSPHTDPTDTPKVNGEAHDVDQQVESLKNELETVRNEKEHLETQYRSLLGKLTTMRNTLGDKLRQDAVRYPPFSYSLTVISISGLMRCQSERTSWTEEQAKLQSCANQTPI